ncbi:MAG: hypothetical protein ACE1ZD_05180, partial [Dehalococcoidia bacterium]
MLPGPIGIRISSIVILLTVLISACGQSTSGPTNNALAGTNPCGYQAPEPTPTPGPPTRTPTPTPTSTFAPPTLASATPTSTPEPPSRRQDESAPPLPRTVEAWQDAIVSVTLTRDDGYPLNQQGLVVEASGSVLTTLDPVDNIVAVTVEVPGRGTFPAELQHLDPRTGAALLKVDACGICGSD